MREERGSVLTEALIILPVIVIFTAGVLEFGNVLWQRQQLQAGVRDAARYYARCRPTFNICSKDIARNIAFYGTPTPVIGTTPERVPGWSDPTELTVSDPQGTMDPTTTVITVTGSNVYQASPWFAAFGINEITVEYTHQQRYIGW